jgi:hypothetical protein
MLQREHLGNGSAQREAGDAGLANVQLVEQERQVVDVALHGLDFGSVGSVAMSPQIVGNDAMLPGDRRNDLAPDTPVRAQRVNENVRLAMPGFGEHRFVVAEIDALGGARPDKIKPFDQRTHFAEYIQGTGDSGVRRKMFAERNQLVGIDAAAQRRSEMHAKLGFRAADCTEDGDSREFPLAASEFGLAKDLTEGELGQGIRQRGRCLSHGANDGRAALPVNRLQFVRANRSPIQVGPPAATPVTSPGKAHPAGPGARWLSVCYTAGLAIYAAVTIIAWQAGLPMRR